jgi:casein kinase 1
MASSGSTNKTSLLQNGLFNPPSTFINTLVLIKDTYLVGKKIGYGSFGEVYEGTDTINRKSVAIKIEPIETKSEVLKHEYKVYRDIYKPGSDLAQIYYFGIEDDYRVLVMDSLGKSLGQLHRLCKSKFSLKTTLILADQMLNRIEYLHNNDYIHRDLKPENFLMGKGFNNNKVYLIDYGLAKRYRQSGKHIAFKNGKNLVGTARYASINSHLGVQLSRKDDLESLAYIMIFFVKGRLPWQSLKTNNKEEKYQGIMRVKASTSTKTLCQDIPNEFKLFIDHVKSLDFIEKPNYKYLRGLIRQCMVNHNLSYDLQLDFT